MVTYRSVPDCTNSSRNSPVLSFHRLPSNPVVRSKWKRFCRRADKAFERQKDQRICGVHFRKSDCQRSLNGRIDVKTGTCPSIFKIKVSETNISPREKRLESKKTGTFGREHLW